MACVAVRLYRPPRQKFRKFLAATGGKSWIQAAASAVGKSIVISAKMNRSVPASSKVARARLRLSTLTRARESRINVKPFTVRLCFRGDLDFFLRSKTRNRTVERTLSEKTSIKDIIESCGIPHPEVDTILVNGQYVGFDHTLADDADMELFPVENSNANTTVKHLQEAHIVAFVADGHLGTLTRNLRLLGFDVAYDQKANDRQLLDLMVRENRALLTRDRRLLMHAIVQHGYCPRSQNAEEQTIEVVRRFKLLELIAPFTRCLRCNARLQHAAKADVIEELEPLTKIHYREFRRCPGCGQIYWAGSHFEKLKKRIKTIQTRLADKSAE